MRNRQMIFIVLLVRELQVINLPSARLWTTRIESESRARLVILLVLANFGVVIPASARKYRPENEYRPFCLTDNLNNDAYNLKS